MLPNCLQAVVLLEDCIDSSEMVLCGVLEQEAFVVSTVINDVPIKDSLPHHGLSPNYSVDVAKDQDVEICRGVQIYAQIRIYAVFDRRNCQ